MKVTKENSLGVEGALNWAIENADKLDYITTVNGVVMEYDQRTYLMLSGDCAPGEKHCKTSCCVLGWAAARAGLPAVGGIMTPKDWPELMALAQENNRVGRIVRLMQCENPIAIELMRAVDARGNIDAKNLNIGGKFDFDVQFLAKGDRFRACKMWLDCSGLVYLSGVTFEECDVALVYGNSLSVDGCTFMRCTIDKDDSRFSLKEIEASGNKVDDCKEGEL